MPLPRLTGAQVRQLRERAELSRADLAQALGISPASLANIEHGAKDAPLSPYLQRLLLLLLRPTGRALLAEAEQEIALFLRENAK